jgi:pimeloyl-ACP methyl ester carboxylesterase
MEAQPMSTIPVEGGCIAYRRMGNGRPLIVLNGLTATSADWDPGFLERLASANELVLLDNCGIGGSTDDGAPFDIARLARDAARVIDALDLRPASVLGWSMGGFIAQTLAVEHPDHVDRLVLLSTDAGGASAVVADRTVLDQLIDTSFTPHEQARRLLAAVFPADIAESVYRDFGDVVAQARAALSPELVARQVTAVDAWHRDGVADRLDGLKAPTLVLTGTEDIVIPPSNAISLATASPAARLAQFPGGGHAFMAQEPEAAANVINEFLAL